MWIELQPVALSNHCSFLAGTSAADGLGDAVRALANDVERADVVGVEVVAVSRVKEEFASIERRLAAVRELSALVAASVASAEDTLERVGCQVQHRSVCNASSEGQNLFVLGKLEQREHRCVGVFEVGI